MKPVRVVAGEARGRRLVAPDAIGTRPTGDRVREAIANSLHSLDAVEGATVIDLFAGSGALGIELLSRGALHCTFVDHARSAVTAIRQNLAITGLADRSDIVVGDAMTAARRVADVALVDPPYAFEHWQELLDDLGAPLAVLESNRAIEPGPGWDVVREKRYGGTVVTFVRRTNAG